MLQFVEQPSEAGWNELMGQYASMESLWDEDYVNRYISGEHPKT